MPKRWVEYAVGLGLLLGPLVYALTLEAEVVEVVKVVESPEPAWAPPQALEVIPVELVPVVATPAEVASPEPSAAVDDGGALAFAFVTSAGLVLSTEADLVWGTGRLRAHAGPAAYTAAKRADGARIPASLYAQRGRTFDLYDASGKICTARLGDLYVLAQHNGPSLYDVFYDEGDESYEDFERRNPSKAEIRAQVWAEATDGAPWLVADLVADPACDGARWARDSTLPPPTILHASSEPSDVTRRRLAEHEASEDLVRTRVEYEAWYGELSEESRGYYDDWSKLAASHPATVTSWLDDDGTPRLVELEFGTAEGGCGEGFDARLSSLDVVTREGFEPSEHATGPVAIFDADLDGSFELLYIDDAAEPDRLVSATAELSLSWYLDEAFYCPC